MTKTPRLPHVNQLNPSVSLDAIGRALAHCYDDLIDEGIPEHLAVLVRRVETGTPRTDRRKSAVAVVVEDDVAVRELAETLLEETELTVLGCPSAEAALDILRQRGRDVALVFADIRLAGDMDGVELAKAVATLWPTARLVLTSGFDNEHLAELPDRAVFIKKPWSAVELLSEAERAERPAHPRPT